ncbi:cellulose binding domain-containing protein [Nonomuraea sp. M3C6]|uniref:Cellulose binding domain-containing protein n=1 Tax=Nonomuraea marmarensis TaxID=3351344 RepID=A0ABW7ABD6_9ACTN
MNVRLYAEGIGKTPLFGYGFGLIYEQPAPDTSPPTAPGTPAASAITSSSLSLTWPASSDTVGVTGYDVVRVQGSTETTVATSATASAAVSGLTASTAYTFALYARDAAGNRSPRSGTVSVTTTSGTGGCSVTPSTQSQWNNGYVIQVAVTNTGTTTVNTWNVTFTLPPGHTITGSWNATLTVNGRAVTARNAASNGTLGHGASASFGFQGSRPSGDTGLPSGYTCG